MSDETIPTAVFTAEERSAWGELESKMLAVLEHRRRGYELPELDYTPADDGLLVWRLPAAEQKTEAGLVLPDHGIDNETDDMNPFRQRQVANQRVVSLGLILDAGCRARDWMRAHGIFVGDIVKFSKYAGEETSLHWLALGGRPVGARDLKDFLQINHSDIQGSFDLAARVKAGDMRLVYVSDDSGNGLHIYKPVVKKETAHV